MGKIYYNGVDYSTPTSSSSGVAGVKGSAESGYRTGNVNITPANIGLGNVNNTADKDKSVKKAGTADTATNAGTATLAKGLIDGKDTGGDPMTIKVGWAGSAISGENYGDINGIAAYISDNSEQGTQFIKDADEDAIKNWLGTMKPEAHASTLSEYGCGTSTQYGHVKLSDNYASSAGSASAGVAASSKALYDAYTKLAPVELYNSTSTAYNANITLSQNVSNFKTIEIFFADNDGDDNSIRIRATAGKFKMNSHAYVGGTWYDKFTYYAVSGTKLNFSSSYQKNQGGVVESGNYHKIYRVVGYKY